MSRWDERSIKNDFNEAAQDTKQEPDKPDDPELKYDPPGPSGPAPGGGNSTAWDRHQTQRSQGMDKTKDPTPSKTVTEEFNKKSK